MWIVSGCKQVGGGKVITGFDAAVTGLEVGGTRTQRVPPEQAYGVLLILHKLPHWRSVNSLRTHSHLAFHGPRSSLLSVAAAPSTQMTAV